MQYKTKPTIVEAYEYRQEDDVVLILNWLRYHLTVESYVEVTKNMRQFRLMLLPSKQGLTPVNFGDFVIIELDGSGCYACAPDVFKAKYQVA